MALFKSKPVMAMVASLVGTQAVAAELKPGDMAPDFTLVGSDGETYRLADYRGKQAVVLAWFPKAFTPGCTKQCTSFRADGESLKKFDVAYFTASCDTVETNRKFAESLAADYPILSDPDGKVATAYGVIGTIRRWPQRWTFYIGTDGRILEIDKEVDVAAYGVDVAKRLRALGIPERKEDR